MSKLMQLLNHPAVKEFLEQGGHGDVSVNGMTIDGFYKSGTVDLVINDENELVCKQRYDQLTKIETFDDLVWVNYEWWQSSKSRFDGWSNPTEFWLNHMVRLNIVTVETKTVTVVK